MNGARRMPSGKFWSAAGALAVIAGLVVPPAAGAAVAGPAVPAVPSAARTAIG